MPAISCSAPGKVILCGEHAVVYGKPAIAIPVLNVATKCTIIARPTAPSDEILIVAPNIGLKCEYKCLIDGHPIRATIKRVLEELSLDHLPVCEIQIRSTLPTAAGLGSSASTSVALIRALSTFLGHPFNNEQVNQIAYEIEKIHHGTPSGIDNSVVTYGKTLFFIKGQPLHFLDPKAPITLVIADSGIKSSTAKVVSGLKSRRAAEPEKYDALFDQIGEISLQVKESLESGNLEKIGGLLSQNQAVLQAMGVSCSKLDELVSCALEHGAKGAKLSGGGQGGNMIALVDPDQAEAMAGYLKSAGATNTIITHVPAKG